MCVGSCHFTIGRSANTQNSLMHFSPVGGCVFTQLEIIAEPPLQGVVIFCSSAQKVRPAAAALSARIYLE